ncbi:hypothetical protein BJ944DRAFT_260244 [Cunninghamella echinulata]|nr:hypothetical protein BJ944DRAFT_260244 [Cunninghamella echinulata]
MSIIIHNGLLVNSCSNSNDHTHTHHQVIANNLNMCNTSYSFCSSCGIDTSIYAHEDHCPKARGN